MKYFIHLPMKMEPIVSSETSAIRNQTPGNYPKRNKLHIIFIVAPCILIPSKYFIYQQMHFVSALYIIKIYIKTYSKTAPTCFGLRPSSGSLHLNLAKVAFIT